MKKLTTTSLLAIGSLVASSVASAVATIEIDVIEANTTATQAEVSFIFGGDLAGIAPVGFNDFITIDLTGSVLDGLLAGANYPLNAGNSSIVGTNAVNGGNALVDVVESRNQNGGGTGFSRLGFDFSDELTNATAFAGTTSIVFATNGLVADADFDGLDIDWGLTFNGGVAQGASAGVTSVAPVPEASSFAAFAGIFSLAFLATRRRK